MPTDGRKFQEILISLLQYITVLVCKSEGTQRFLPFVMRHLRPAEIAGCILFILSAGSHPVFKITADLLQDILCTLHRECHYDSARSQKKKGHGRTPGRFPGCTYRLSRFSEGTFQNVLWLLKSNDLAWCKKFVIFFCIFIIFSFTFVSPFTYSVLGEIKADMILKNYEKILFLYL